MVQKKNQVNKEISSSSRARIGKRGTDEDLQVMYDSLSDMIMILNRDHKIMMANKATADFLKLPMDKIIGNNCFKLMHGTDWPNPQCPLEKMMESKEREEIELYFDERRIWAQVMFCPIFDRKRSLVRIIHIVRDITERKQIENDLKLTNTIVTTQQETSPDGILVVNEKGEMTSFNQRFIEIWGIPADIAESRSDEGALHFVMDKIIDPDGFLTLVNYLYEHREKKSQDEIGLKDGRILDRYSAPMFGADGHYYGRVWYFRDITARKQAEEALKESEQKFRAIFDKASDGMFLLDLKTRKFLMCNAKCLQTLGYAQEEFLNLEIPDIHPPDELPLIFEEIAKFMKGEEGVRHDLRFRRKDGSFFFSDLSPSLVTLAGRKFILIVYRDITERKKTEEEKRQANEQLTVLVKKLEDRNTQNIILSEMREMLQACSTMEEAGPIIRSLMEKLFPNSEGALFMMSPSRSDLESVARWGDFPEDVDDNVFAPEACWALRRGRTYIVENMSVGPLCPHLKHPPATAYVCLPLIAKSDVLGLLHLRNRKSTQIQSEQNVISDLKDMAVILSEYLSLSIANIQLNERLARESVRDPLTGLFNRRFMIESLIREIKRAERNQTQVGIIMADIDHFKQFNDKYGHAAGDIVLAKMGSFFKTRIRSSDVACRYGGEEFVFFLPESSAENTFKRADRMREEVKNLEVHYGGELLASITLSMGISTYPDQGSNAEDLLRVADAALYKAKQEGRDRVIAG
jgi:diguanylate cyclase (GGDEF)-like protein/PAS domain S-box-containing protein